MGNIGLEGPHRASRKDITSALSVEQRHSKRVRWRLKKGALIGNEARDFLYGVYMGPS